MLRIWCALLTQDTVDILLLLLYSEEECQQKKLMNKCSTSKIKTHHTSLNGFQTILNHLFVISHQRVLRWLLLSLVIPLLSKKCSRELLNNLLLCSEEKLSYTGIPEKVWTKWNSLKLNLTWTILFLNINNIKTLLLKKKKNMMKMKEVQHFDWILNLLLIYFIWIFFESSKTKSKTIFLLYKVIIILFTIKCYFTHIILKFSRLVSGWSVTIVPFLRN